MKKFKKGLALSLALAMGLSLCACGKDTATTTEGTTTGGDEGTTAEAAGGDEGTTVEEAASGEHETMEAPAAEGEKICIYSWNTEMGELVTDEFLKKYPEYKDLIECVNLGVGGTSDEYKTQLESAISAGGDKYPSIIAMDNDVAKAFMESDYICPVSEGGITEAMYSEAYAYTKAYASYDDGLRGLSWQATPGGFCYRSDLAQEVLGVSEPDDVQEHVKDWDTFFATADKMKEAGYKMLSGPDDIKYVCLDQKTSPWVKDDTLNIDQAVKDYLETAKKLYDGDYTNKTSMWDDAWTAGMDKDVFGYFGCTWFTYWSLNAPTHKADYRMCAGPADYHWGGTYMAMTKDCPNKALAGFVMYTICCDTDFMAAHMAAKSDFVNNKAAVQKNIDEGNGAADTLGGQNPVEVWAAQCDNINLENATQYDSTFNGYLDNASQAYNSGEAATIDAALDIIKNKVRESYSYITVE